MIKLLLKKVISIDKKIKCLVLKGVQFSISICFISALVLITYELFYNSPEIYYIGLSIFKLGITFIATFLTCGFAFNEIQKELG